MSGKTAFKTECSPWPPPIESYYYDLAASARLLRYKDSFSQNITAEYVGFTEKNDFSATFYSSSARDFDGQNFFSITRS